MKDVPHGIKKKTLSYNNAKYVGVAITHKNSIVLCRRIEFCPINKVKVPFGGFWSVFCGSIENKETAPEAGVREVKEESGLDIEKENLNFIGNINDLALFQTEIDYIPTNIELNFEHTEFGIFNISECHTSPDPVDIEIIHAIQYNHISNQ